MMPYAVAHRQKAKARVICSARRLFNRHGLDKVSINQVTASAQLTRGVVPAAISQARAICMLGYSGACHAAGVDELLGKESTLM